MVFLRILLSLGVATLGAVIPGFLHVRVGWERVAVQAGGALALFVITYFFTPNVLPPQPRAELSTPPTKPADGSPRVRLILSDPQSQHAIERAAEGMRTELRNWNEIRTEYERQSLLEFTDRFERCPQQFVSNSPIPENGENRTKFQGVAFDFEIRKGSNARQVILRDVVVEVVDFHSVAPTFIAGASLSRKPLMAVEMRNLRALLPWKFKAKWIADSYDSTFRPFEAEQIHVTTQLWDAYKIKLLALDRGIYRFNVFVTLQQDDEHATNVRITPSPLTIGFFSSPEKTDPDYEFLRTRFQERGGHARFLFPPDS